MASSHPDSRLVPPVRLQATTFDASLRRSGSEHFDVIATSRFMLPSSASRVRSVRVALPAPADDRAALITGASSGIGEAIAVELARRVYQLVLVARRTYRLHALAENLSVKAHVLPADLSDR